MKTSKSDFKIKCTKGSGPGGQHKNKVETCAIVTHIPTGMKEKCQDTRSKLKNIEIATERLNKRIEEKQLSEKQNSQNEFRKKQIQDTKAIRTYNYARQEVVDHRTGKRANLAKVLNGSIDLLR